MKNPALVVLSVLTLGLLGHTHRQPDFIKIHVKKADQRTKKRLRKLKENSKKRNRAA